MRAQCVCVRERERERERERDPPTHSDRCFQHLLHTVTFEEDLLQLMSNHEMCTGYIYFLETEARYRSVVERSVMVRWVIGSILHSGPIELFLVSATSGVTKAVVCSNLSVG